MTTQELQTRYTALLGFNTKQWWVYDEENDCYIDIPTSVSEQIKNHSDNVDEQQDFLNQILNTLPNWLNDKEHTYYGEMDI